MFPNQFFCDTWVVGFWRADHGWQDIGLERRAWTLAQGLGPAKEESSIVLEINLPGA